MVKRLPLYKPKEVVRKLKRCGFVEFHQKGSHLVLKNPVTNRMTVVPMHVGKDIPRGLLHNIVTHQAGITIEKFLES